MSRVALKHTPAFRALKYDLKQKRNRYSYQGFYLTLATIPLFRSYPTRPLSGSNVIHASRPVLLQDLVCPIRIRSNIILHPGIWTVPIYGVSHQCVLMYSRTYIQAPSPEVAPIYAQALHSTRIGYPRVRNSNSLSIPPLTICRGEVLIVWTFLKHAVSVARLIRKGVLE